MLNVNGNQLSELPNDIGQCQYLELLYCDSNKIASLPSSIGRLDSLKGLSVSGAITELPMGLVNLSQLEELYVDNNNIRSLPDEIGNLKKLRVLNLAFNQLDLLPISLSDLIALQTLNVCSMRYQLRQKV